MPLIEAIVPLSYVVENATGSFFCQPDIDLLEKQQEAFLMD